MNGVYIFLTIIILQLLLCEGINVKKNADRFEVDSSKIEYTD